MDFRAVTLLFIASVALIILMPSESTLGDSYKLVYFHVPITVITVISMILFPALHFKTNYAEIRAFSTATSLYSGIHLIISSIFMFVAWGGIIFSEIRFAFSVTLFLFAITHTSLCFLDLRLARAYSFFIYPVILYFYIQLTKAEFQLHPATVKMPAPLYIPFIFSFPLVFLLYFRLKNFVKSKC